MNRSSISSSPVNGRSGQIETRYKTCPLCGSSNIHRRREAVVVTPPGGKSVKLKLLQWKCMNCGESFLTPSSRRQLDEILRPTPITR
ncbi:MAG TPA: YgiT-type zinc finger protein [Tepidisphaeraceae bacterium]|nr:YgiT-type zinc finger protein [Tepidisphaeraceae bacterium]